MCKTRVASAPKQNTEEYCVLPVRLIRDVERTCHRVVCQGAWVDVEDRLEGGDEA
jgi:hypothetical protein